jgi:hypothetical protein
VDNKGRPALEEFPRPAGAELPAPPAVSDSALAGRQDDKGWSEIKGREWCGHGSVVARFVWKRNGNGARGPGRARVDLQSQYEKPLT